MAASNVHSAVQVNLVYELRQLTEYRIYYYITTLRMPVK